jgi:large subunit ribosomal protein L17
MKKRVFGRKLSRNTNTRKALFRSLAASVVANGAITTTKAKAKAVQDQLEKLVTIAKDTSVASRRKLYATLANDRKTADKLFTLTQSVFKDVKGGYTRIISLPRRRGDFAEMARLEWSRLPEKKTAETKSTGKVGKGKTGKKNSKSNAGKETATAKAVKEAGPGGLKGRLLSRVGRKKPASE